MEGLLSIFTVSGEVRINVEWINNTPGHLVPLPVMGLTKSSLRSFNAATPDFIMRHSGLIDITMLPLG